MRDALPCAPLQVVVDQVTYGQPNTPHPSRTCSLLLCNLSAVLYLCTNRPNNRLPYRPVVQLGIDVVPGTGRRWTLTEVHLEQASEWLLVSFLSCLLFIRVCPSCLQDDLAAVTS